MTYLGQILVNLVSMAVGAGLHRLWSTKGHLYLQRFTWHGTDISGRWHSYDDDPGQDNDPTGQAVIVQSGKTITMNLKRHAHRSGEPATNEYRYEGRFESRQMTLLFEAADRPDYVLGAIVLHLDQHAKVFAGSTTYFSADDGRVVTRSIWLLRA